MRVKVEATGLYTYPDVVAVCGERRLERRGTDTLLNPTLIFEVLSPTTESYDRGRKFENYRQIESLREYVLIAQDEARVQCYRRQADGTWIFAEASGRDGSLRLTSVEATLSLAEVYSGVEFGDEDVPAAEPAHG
jgi:Uma2 family endonuclease